MPSDEKDSALKLKDEDIEDNIKDETNDLEKKISCPICANRFQFHGLMKTHIRLTHKTVCCFCYEDLNGKKQLKEHMIESHKEEKKQSCTICKKTFFWKSNLHRHIKESHKAKCSKLQKNSFKSKLNVWVIHYGSVLKLRYALFTVFWRTLKSPL